MPENDAVTKEASALWRSTDWMAKTANAGAPLALLREQVDVVRRQAEVVIACIDAQDGSDTARVEMILPDGLQQIHSQVFGDHQEGTLPDTIPEEWKDD